MTQHSEQPTKRRLRTALNSLGSAAAFLVLAACSTTPASKSSFDFVNVPKQIQAPASEEFQPKPLEIPAGWLTIESTASLGEKDLFDRIRLGFGLTDVDHPRVDLEEKWFAKHPDYLDRTLRRGERYLYYIVSQLEERNMPRELALLPVVESAFVPDALSRAKAAGLWQFIPSTGTRYGLKQNVYYDGRRDIVESTRAALDYLQFLSEEFEGDWLLAVAAYNCGELNVSRAIERNRAKNKPTDFFSLDLPKETKAYVPKLLAIRRIVDQPERYGLEFGELDNEPYFVTVDVGGQIDLNVAAELAGMSKEEFVALNPGFTKRYTDPNGPHQLLIPVENEKDFLAKLADLPADKRVPMVSYRVRKGDSLKSISRRYGMSIAELRDINQLKANAVKPGQEILLYSSAKPSKTAVAASSGKAGASAATHTVRSGETLWSIAKSNGVDTGTLAALNSMATDDTLAVGQKLVLPGAATLASAGNTGKTLELMTYTVRRGDTLSRIAKLFQVEVSKIMSWNKLRSATSIKAGQRLILYVDDARRLGG